MCLHVRTKDRFPPSHKHTHVIKKQKTKQKQKHKAIQKIKVMFISVKSLKDNLLSVLEKSKCVSDKLMDYALKNAEHLHFLLCTGMLDIYFIKKYKNKIKKKPKDTHNPE